MISKLKTPTGIQTLVGQLLERYEKSKAIYYKSLVKSYVAHEQQTGLFFIAQLEINEMKMMAARNSLLLALGDDELPRRCSWCHEYTDTIEPINNHDLCPTCSLEAQE